jgi:homoserine dehydrogenase
VVQAIPSATSLAGEAYSQVIESFRAGADVVTATKSHLVTRWSDLERAGVERGCAIRVSAAAGAALPAVDLARRGFRGHECQRVRGSLNGTSNFVLNALGEGALLSSAIAAAQRSGIAERDPSGDLGGHDAAAKIVIINNLLWGRGASVDDVHVQGITDETASAARDAARDGMVLRSVATASPGVTPSMRVGLEAVGPEDSLYRLPGAEKAVEFDWGAGGSVVVSGGRSSPRGAALSLLKDALNLATGDRSPGFG